MIRKGRGWLLASAMLLLAVLAGCVTPPTAPSALPTTEASTSTPAPANAISAPPSWPSLVEAATIRPGELDNVARPQTADFNVLFKLPCDAPAAANRAAGHAWTYPDINGVVVHAVAAYDPQPGLAVVEAARSALGGCTTWGDSEVRKTMMFELEVQRPDAADGHVAYCYELTVLTGPITNKKLVVCEALLSRGPLVALVGTAADASNDAQRRLRQVVPGAAAGLRRALPV